MLSPPEQHHRQPESRASTLLQEEQLSDDVPVVHRHLEKRYEPPPSRLPKKERSFKDFQGDLGRRFLHFMGIRKESSQPKRRSVLYHTTGGSSLPNLSLIPGSSSLRLSNQVPNNLGEKQFRGCVSSPQDEGMVQRAEELDRVRLQIVFPTLTLPITSLDFILRTYKSRFRNTST